MSENLRQPKFGENSPFCRENAHILSKKIKQLSQITHKLP